MKIKNFKKAQLTPEVIHDGNGLCPHACIFDGPEFDAPIRFFNFTVVPPQCSFGQHKHGDDNEIYVVIKGSGKYTEDGVTVEVSEGDVIVNAKFASHGIENTGDEDMQLLVIEGYNR